MILFANIGPDLAKTIIGTKTIFNYLSQGTNENFISFIYLIYLSNLGLFLPLNSSYSNKCINYFA